MYKRFLLKLQTGQESMDNVKTLLRLLYMRIVTKALHDFKLNARGPCEGSLHLLALFPGVGKVGVLLAMNHQHRALHIPDFLHQPKRRAVMGTFEHSKNTLHRYQARLAAGQWATQREDILLPSTLKLFRLSCFQSRRMK